MKNGTFYKYCTLCASSGVGKRRLPAGKLVLSKFHKWKNAVDDFKDHETKTFYKNSVLDTGQFLEISEGRKNPIDQETDSRLKEQIAKNRKRLTPVITKVDWCGRQGVALRGYRAAGKLIYPISWEKTKRISRCF